MHRLRFLRIILKFLFSKKGVSPLNEFVLNFRVTPFDVEFTRQYTHIYLSMMALGRWDTLLRSTDMVEAFKQGWVPLTYSEHIRYRRSLRIFQKVKLTSRLIYWDEKMVYFEHKFETEKGIAALGYARGAYRGKGGFIPPSTWSPEMRTKLPKIPKQIAPWVSLDDSIHID